jgi:hypothetical protein
MRRVATVTDDAALRQGLGNHRVGLLARDAHMTNCGPEDLDARSAVGTSIAPRGVRRSDSRKSDDKLCMPGDNNNQRRQNVVQGEDLPAGESPPL